MVLVQEAMLREEVFKKKKGICRQPKKIEYNAMRMYLNIVGNDEFL